MVVKTKRKTKIKNKNNFVNILKKLKNNFNLGAFVFNSFYYIIKGMPGWFCIYATAALLGITFSLLIGKELSLALHFEYPYWFFFGFGLLAVHLVSGFMANRHIADFREQNADINLEAPISYLAMSKKRFFILSFLSGSLYTCYWMYKNWTATSQATKEKMLPVFRGYVFEILFIYPLFMRIHKSINQLNNSKSLALVIAGICSTLVYLISGIVSLFELNANFEFQSNLVVITLLLINIFITLVYTLAFLPAQSAINSYVAQTFPEKGQKQKLTWGEIVVVLIGFIFSYLSYGLWLKTTNQFTYLSSLSPRQQIAIGQTIGYAYRNIDGYKTVCAQSEFELKEYPTEFKTAMADELDGLEQVLARDNLTLEKSFVVFLQPDILEKIHEELYNELKIIASPEDTGVSSACQILDQDAADIAQNVADEIRPFYHEVLIPLFQK